MGELFNTAYLLRRRRALRRRQTPAERIVWSQLRNRRLAGLKFYRQYSVGNYILDFYCQAKNLAVEIDGRHHADPEEREYDRRRTEYLNRVGITVVRFWNDEVMGNCADVVARICRAAGVGLPLSPSKDIEGDETGSSELRWGTNRGALSFDKLSFLPCRTDAHPHSTREL